jgi:hypothetical protein
MAVGTALMRNLRQAVMFVVGMALTFLVVLAVGVLLALTMGIFWLCLHDGCALRLGAFYMGHW